MTTRTLSYSFFVSILSLGFASAVNCGGENPPSTVTGPSSSSSATSSSSSSSGMGGAGGGSNTCKQDSDCMEANTVCEQGMCITTTCTNMMKDDAETDVDCGGPSCLPCSNGKTCKEAGDCASNSCADMNGTFTCVACAKESDCLAAPGTYCESGVCTAKKASAAACTDSVQCASGFCPPQDGVCCDALCDNPCEACLGAKTGGADGACGAVTINTDPDIECGTAPVTTCGANGTGCNGDKSAPGCNAYPSATVCAPVACSAGEAQGVSLCDGQGTCVAPAKTSCAPYQCDGVNNVCLTTCKNNAECQNTHYCDTGTSKCVVKKTNGNTCTSAGQCASGFCPNQDGVCCDTACDTTCRACVQNKTGAASGTCGNVSGGTDPDNECSMILAPNCNGAGQCG